MTKLYACKTDKVNAAMVTAQERHCHVSTEEAERYASPANCWLMTPSPQEVMIGASLRDPRHYQFVFALGNRLDAAAQSAPTAVR